MNEISKYEAYKKKLEGLSDEHNLIATFKCDKYPITMTVRPISGAGEQLSMLAEAEEGGYISPDASIVFTMKDGVISYKTSQIFTISDALFSKLKGLFKNMHYCWVQYFYREAKENHRLAEGDKVGLDNDEDVLSEAEPLEIDELDEECTEGDMDALEYLTIRASEIVREEGTASLSLLQRQLWISKARATAVMNELEAQGVVGSQNGSAPREVLYNDVIEDDIPAFDSSAKEE